MLIPDRFEKSHSFSSTYDRLPKKSIENLKLTFNFFLIEKKKSKRFSFSKMAEGSSTRHNSASKRSIIEFDNGRAYPVRVVYDTQNGDLTISTPIGRYHGTFRPYSHEFATTGIMTPTFRSEIDTIISQLICSIGVRVQIAPYSMHGKPYFYYRAPCDEVYEYTLKSCEDTTCFGLYNSIPHLRHHIIYVRNKQGDEIAQIRFATDKLRAIITRIDLFHPMAKLNVLQTAERCIFKAFEVNFIQIPGDSAKESRDGMCAYIGVDGNPIINRPRTWTLPFQMQMSPSSRILALIVAGRRKKLGLPGELWGLILTLCRLH